MTPQQKAQMIESVSIALGNIEPWAMKEVLELRPDLKRRLQRFMDGERADIGDATGVPVLRMVAGERILQDAKWGQQNHHPYKYLVILGEEVGEANKAAIEDDWDGYRQELIQVAAVAVAMVESIDRNGPPSE